MDQSGQIEAPSVLVSVVSHGHRKHVEKLLGDFGKTGNREHIHVVLTLNKQGDEPSTLPANLYELDVKKNEKPLGFAANHNAVFHHAFGDANKAPRKLKYFCVLNPDIRLDENTFSALLNVFGQSGEPLVGLIAPGVYSADGAIEDSARDLPTPGKILAKAVRIILGLRREQFEIPEDPDWVGGMFMLFDADAYEMIGGFDERYRLYYEDVDICCRLRLAGYRLRYRPEIKVTHSAQRSSHRELRYLIWHLQSMLRFFFSSIYRQCKHKRHRLPAR